MRDLFTYSIRSFLEDHLVPGDLIILGLSGGPDSSALFEAILEIQPNFPLKIHVVHVDHGWRQESKYEATILQKKVEIKGIPFHQKVLDPKETTSNLEDKARKERWQFFKEIYDKLGAKALLLGHQKDDLVETVLKRLFEGAHLENLGGMEKKSFIENRVILRPLLGIEKVTILEWLEKRNIAYFVDRTNDDLKFNRSRLRHLLIPTLEEKFGKGIKGNLYQLSQRTYALREYLDRKVLHWKERGVKGPLGSYYDLSGCFEKIEIEHFLLEVSKEQDIGISSSECDHLSEALLNQKSIRVERKGGTWIADRGRIFLLLAPLTDLYWTCQKIEKRPNSLGWEHLWREGKLIFSSELTLKPIFSSLKNCDLVDRYRRYKVPCFLRAIVPAFISEKMDLVEVLSGQGFFEGGITYQLGLQIGERQINEVLLK